MNFWRRFWFLCPSKGFIFGTSSKVEYASEEVFWSPKRSDFGLRREAILVSEEKQFWHFSSGEVGLRREAFCTSTRVKCASEKGFLAFHHWWSGSPKRSILHFYTGEMCLRKGLVPPKRACASEEGLWLPGSYFLMVGGVHGTSVSHSIGCLFVQTIAID